jgi:hypothetical protein
MERLANAQADGGKPVGMPEVSLAREWDPSERTVFAIGAKLFTRTYRSCDCLIE